MSAFGGKADIARAAVFLLMSRRVTLIDRLERMSFPTRHN